MGCYISDTHSFVPAIAQSQQTGTADQLKQVFFKKTGFKETGTKIECFRQRVKRDTVTMCSMRKIMFFKL